MARYNINGNDLSATYGIDILAGGYEILQQAPKRKDIYSHSWNDENGTDREISAVYFESKSMAIPLFIQADDISDYKTKITAFNAIVLAAARFTIDIISLDRRWSLLFDSISEMKFYRFSDSGVIGTFTLNVIDDTPQTITAIP